MVAEGIIGTLIIGLIIGALARLVTPGTAGLGCLPTVAVGVGGAFLGQLIAGALGVGYGEQGLLGLLFSVLGAVLILLLLQAIAGRRRI
ncbi:MAG TPA: GlsB/YeaQ/YmgE family stress response membrane protein [Egibacteraceae bacterium]|nr:GlsB/YeaQ/YmgE family stress response membrane protein [Egibacteraceae bacterium]